MVNTYLTNSLKRFKKYNMSLEGGVIGKLAASAVGGIVLEQLMEIRPFIFMMLILVVCDLITGISAARSKGEKISSWGLRRTVQKFVLYGIAIALSKGMEYTFSFPQLVYVVAFYICTTEFFSNLENIGDVTGTNLVSKVKELVGSKIRDL